MDVGGVVVAGQESVAAPRPQRVLAGIGTTPAGVSLPCRGLGDGIGLVRREGTGVGTNEFAGVDELTGGDELTATAELAGRGAVSPPVIKGYKIGEEIGGGGQAKVFRAVNKTGREVALKVFRDRAPGEERSEEPIIITEVGALAALNHPNIVQVLDWGDTDDEPRRFYLAMNFVHGRQLDRYLWERSGRRAKSASKHQGGGPASSAAPASDLGDLLRLFVKIADAINAAHLRLIGHRDLKPSNILVDDDGEPHVVDFGLARSGMEIVILRDRGGESRAVAVAGDPMMTLAWASPEQVDGRSDLIDVRSDVYSLGLILYHMLTGGMFPYPLGSSTLELADHIRLSDPTPPSRAVPPSESEGGSARMWGTCAVDPVLEAIVLKALSKRREDRYQTPGEFARQVEAYLQAAERVNTTTSTLAGTEPDPPRRQVPVRRLVYLALVSAAAAAVACAVLNVVLNMSFKAHFLR